MIHSVCLNNITLWRGNKHIFDNFSLCFEKQKTTAIIAPSGAGKTSLLDIVAGHLSVKQGSVLCDNKDMSYIFQEDRLLPWHTAERNILLPLEHFCGRHTDRRFTFDEAKNRVAKYMKACGIEDKAQSKPPTLSGGEKQRVSIARAFAHPCNTLLMDEAFQSLDLRIKFQLMELFSSLIKAEKKTVLLVTHDIREALCLADRIIVCIGTPMSICFDTKISHQDDKKSMAHTYINLSEENLSIQKKILDILS